MQKNKFIFIWIAGLVIIGGAILLSIEQGDIVLLLNRHRSAFGDVFFRYTTYAGSIFPYLIFLLYFIVKKQKYQVLGFILIVVVHAIIAYVFKHFIFGALPRPTVFFNEGILNLIPNIEYHSSYSLPSGHTITTFAMIIYLLLSHRIYSKSIISLSMIIALLIGISRMYLMQHFFRDVYLGIILGSLCAITVYSYMSWRYFYSRDH